MKKIIGWVIAAIAVVGIGSAASHSNTPTEQLTTTPASSLTSQQASESTGTPAPTATPEPTPAPTPSYTSTSGTPDSNLSNNSTYINVDGDTVHSPAYSSDDSVPAGASAKCGDGTYSFSENHRGTCSHHGGVAEWL